MNRTDVMKANLQDRARKASQVRREVSTEGTERTEVLECGSLLSLCSLRFQGSRESMRRCRGNLFVEARLYPGRFRTKRQQAARTPKNSPPRSTRVLREKLISLNAASYLPAP